MTTIEFAAWVKHHVTATGADDRTAAALIENREIIANEWNTTLAELKLATHNLVASCRTPKFPNEHTDAIGLEIEAIRTPSMRREEPTAPRTCGVCQGSGMVVVLHPNCIYAGRVVNYQRFGVNYGYVATFAVICDICDFGKGLCRNEESRASSLSNAELQAQPRMMTLGKYYDLTKGLDGYMMLRDYEREQAIRASAGRTEEQRRRDFARMYPGLAKRAGITARPAQGAA
jgi:hypothetical protein